MNSKEYEVEIGGKKITAVFNNLADQANGSVMLKSEGTVVMATAVITKSGKNNPGYFNLTVEYLEKFYATGKILGSQFNHKEGRPSDLAVSAARMTDRTLRPLFEHHIKNAVQIIITVIAVGKADPKPLGINAASMALHISDIPWVGPIGAVHLSKTKGDSNIQINNYLPMEDEANYDLDLLVCGKDNTINMIEAMSFEDKEEDMGNYFDLALVEIAKWEELQKKVRKEIGKEKLSFPKPEISTEMVSLFEEKIKPAIDKDLFSNKSKEVSENMEELWKEITDEKYEASDDLNRYVAQDYFHDYLDKAFHKKALEENARADGRAIDEIRDLYSQAGNISEVLHGSGIFYRGETHVLSVLTLAGPEAMYTINGMESFCKKRFMHHYNFPLTHVVVQAELVE